MSDTNPVIKREQARRQVIVTLTDGRVREGHLMVPAARPIVEVLNSARAFFEFETAGGEKVFLATTAVQSIQVKDFPKLEQRRRAKAATAKFLPA